MKEKSVVEQKMQKLMEMTALFCSQHLDEDYKGLCEKLIRKMARKRNVPFVYGRIEIWAAAAIHAIGSINFLFDRSFKPYASAEDISRYFNTSQSTTSQKSKVIRDMFRMNFWDKEFSTRHSMQSNPFANLVNIGGFLARRQDLPPEVEKMFPDLQ